MSEEAEYRYRLEQERRRRLYLARVRERTQEYLQKYHSMYQEMLDQGLDEYIPQEVERVKELLDRMESSLEMDPEQARTTSLELGSFIGGLFSLGRAVRKEVQTREMARLAARKRDKREAASELQTLIENELTTLKDPVTRDFAFDEIQSIRKEAAKFEPSGTSLESFKTHISELVSQAKIKAEKSAASWRRAREKESLRDSQRVLVDIEREQLQSQVKAGAQMAAHLNQALNELETLGSAAQGSAIEADKFKAELDRITNQAEASIMDGRYMEETANAVVKSLQSCGFVGKKSKTKEGEILIEAGRPSGASANRASFHITLDGALVYRFDKYKGQACKKDVASVVSRMKDIYGIDLYDKQIRWEENPDRISASAKPIPGSERTKRNE